MKLYNVVVHHYIMCDVPLIGPMVEQSRDSTRAENDANNNIAGEDARAHPDIISQFVLYHLQQNVMDCLHCDVIDPNAHEPLDSMPDAKAGCHHGTNAIDDWNSA
jgi:hypothetical protein